MHILLGAVNYRDELEISLHLGIQSLLQSTV